jgi:hypothetical protein
VAKSGEIYRLIKSENTCIIFLLLFLGDDLNNAVIGSHPVNLLTL